MLGVMAADLLLPAVLFLSLMPCQLSVHTCLLLQITALLDHAWTITAQAAGLIPVSKSGTALMIKFCAEIFLEGNGHDCTHQGYAFNMLQDCCGFQHHPTAVQNRLAGAQRVTPTDVVQD